MNVFETIEKMSKEVHRTPLKLTFRKDKHDNEIIAVYQATYNYDPSIKVCYCSKDGHSSICKDYYREDTIPASKEDYIPLLKEIVYNYPPDNYKIVSRINWNK